MPKNPSFRLVVHKELLNLPTLLSIVLFSTFYILLLTSFLNYRLLSAESTSPHFWAILFSLWFGIFTSLSVSESIFFASTALLVSINMVLLIKTIRILTSQKIRLSVGGATILGIISTGCGSCGLSLFSLLGLGASFSFLPFHGLELHLLSIGLLLFSCWYMLEQLYETVYCKMKQKTSRRK